MPERDPSSLPAEAVLAWLAEFGATLAHDLNQPLAAAGNYLSAARQIAARAQGAATPLLDPTLEKAAAQMTRASETLQRLRASLTPGEPQFVEASLHALLRQAAERVERRAQADFVFQFEAADDSVLADPRQIEQALASLMEKALEAPEYALNITTWGAPGAIRVEILSRTTQEPAAPGLPAQSAAFVALALAQAILDTHEGRLEAMPDGDGFAVTLPLAIAGVAP
jgi:phosphoglycerate-specific signal transduction histidine kinase